MIRYYNICNFIICIEAPWFPADSENWQLFQVESGDPDITVRCHIVKSLPPVHGTLYGENDEYSVYSESGTIYRLVKMGTAEGYLAVYNVGECHLCDVYFTEVSFPVFLDSRYFWGGVCLSQLLLPKGVAFIHSSYISYQNKGILFSAPCGTGKSTQADLWRVHRGADIINGDKAAISLCDGSFSVFGLPFCGTSHICHNRSFDLGAIILLSQGKSNKVTPLNGIDAVSRVASNIYLDLYAPGEQAALINLLIDLLSAVKVYSFECTPDGCAVEALEKALIDGGVLCGTQL